LMSAENGKTEFEEAAAERELDELRRAIEESRGRRRRANDAFDEFLKGFGQPPRGAAPAAQPARLPEREPAPEQPKPQPEVEREPVREVERLQVPTARQEPPEERVEPEEPTDEGLFAFAPALAPAPVVAVTQPKPATHSALDAFAHEPTSPANPPLKSIPAALTPSRRSPARSIAPVVVIAVVGLLVAFLLWRGRSPEEALPPAAATAPPPAVAPAPAPPAAATSGTETPPSAEISTIRRVWLLVTVDGKRVLEREVAEGTKIPLNAGSQIVIRAGDAGAVRVSIAGKDQGAFGRAGQPATRTFTVR